MARFDYVDRVPLIEVRLHGPRSSIPVIALLDSGADACLFDVQLAEQFGLRRADADRYPAQGIGGSQWTWCWPGVTFELECLGKRFKIDEPDFANLGPTRAQNRDPMPNLLGREDFFAHFTVHIHQQDATDGYFELDP